MNFDIKTEKGLTETEAGERLRRDGPNELPSAKKHSFLSVVWDVMREPMLLLLLACGTTYLILGERNEAIMLLGFVLVVMGITIVQENKTERALEALRDLSSPRASVIRDGAKRRIPGRDVVMDDIMMLNEGDRVPADAVMLECVNFSVDESLLTGESVPVRKIVWDERPFERPGGDDQPFVYSGTLVVSGHGIARVSAVGAATEMGKIGKALQTVETEITPLQHETGKIVRCVAVFGFLFCLAVAGFYASTQDNVLKGLLAGLTLAMAMIPEEFPVVLTIFLALGAWRMSKKQVLTRRVPAVESLGSATVLCVDKTGTLTVNRMRLQSLCADGGFQTIDGTETALPEAFHELVEFSMLASQKDPFDPMEKAIHDLGNACLAETEHIHVNWTLVQEYPLSIELLALSHVWQSPDGRDYVIAAKGAPEAIFDLCHLDDEEQSMQAAFVREMAGKGLRVLGVAKSLFAQTDLPRIQHDFPFEFIGLIGLADPVRPAVPAAIRECRRAGIRVVMITGDHPETARHIAKEIGFESDRCIIGPELDAMTETELADRIGSARIFARVVPEQKLRIVKALKAAGEIVAMTGDGVNDAPALKSAHIGVAMGGRGTDVARESAALVLLDDDFSSIVGAVRMGRKIFDNIKKAMTYIVAVHMPIAGLSLIPVILGWPLILLPVHIAFLELIIDPSCSVVFEAETEESDLMDRPPRNPKTPLFNRSMLLSSLFQGFSVLAVVLALEGISWSRGLDENTVRSLTFTTLVIANLGLILANRSWSRTIVSMFRSRNVALAWVAGGTVAFLALALYAPFMQNIFRFAALHPNDLAVCFGVGLFSIAWLEALKFLNRPAYGTKP